MDQQKNQKKKIGPDRSISMVHVMYWAHQLRQILTVIKVSRTVVRMGLRLQ